MRHCRRSVFVTGEGGELLDLPSIRFPRSLRRKTGEPQLDRALDLRSEGEIRERAGFGYRDLIPPSLNTDRWNPRIGA